MIVLSVSAKCKDMFNMTIYQQEPSLLDVLDEVAGYVPNSSLGYGDYMEFLVDNDTGQILNWTPFKVERLS